MKLQKWYSKRRATSRGYLRSSTIATRRPEKEKMRARVTKSWTTISHPIKDKQKLDLNVCFHDFFILQPGKSFSLMSLYSSP